MGQADAIRFDRPRRPGRRRLLYAAVTVALLTLPQIRGTLSIFRDGLQSHFDISIEQLGLLLSIWTIPGMIGAVLGGRAVDRAGPRVVLRACLMGAALGLALAALADGWAYMLAALAFVALFTFPLHIAAQTYLIRLFPTRRRRVLSLNMVALSLSGVAVPLLAEALLRLERTDPSVSFSQILHVPFAVVAAALAMGALLYRRRKSLAGPDPAEKAREPQRPRPFGKGAVLLLAMMVLHGTCDSSLFVWMPRVLGGGSFARQVFLPGAVMAGFSLAYVLSRSLLSLLPERSGTRVMLIAPGLLGGVLMLAGLASRSQTWTAAGYVAGAFCWSFEYPAILAALAGGEARRFGSALGANAVALGLATFAMVNSMGLIARGVGEQSMWVILLLPAAGFPLVGLAGAIWVWRFSRRATG